MNFGSFGIGLLDGVSKGLVLGQAIKGIRNESAVNDLREQGMADAKQARSDAIAQTIKTVDTTTQQNGASDQMSMVSKNGPASDDLIGESMKRLAARGPAQGLALSTAVAPSQAYEVGGLRFATQAEAQTAAEKAAPDIMHFFTKQAAPAIYAKLVEQGDMDKAEAWNKWMEQGTTKARLKVWGNAYRAAMMGDHERAADHVFDLYSQYDDGVHPVSKTAVKDEQGNLTGFNVVLKRGQDGKEYSQFIGHDQLRELGLAALSEPQFFELDWRRQREQEQARAAALTKLTEGRQRFNQNIALEGIRLGGDIRKLGIQHDNAVTLEQIRSANEAGRPGPVGKQAADLRALGLSDSDIRQRVLDEHKGAARAPHPDQVRLELYQQLSKNETNQYDEAGQYTEVGGKTFGQLSPALKNAVIARELSALGLSGGSTIPTARPSPSANSLPPLWSGR